tara:strand:- start:107 stop:556 length:450 start_codon:yes stop_codon:yes gene_type:complete
MRYVSPFSSRYGITPFSGSSFSNFEKELGKVLGSLPSLFDVGGYRISDSGSRFARPSWYEHDDAYVARIEVPGVEPKEVSIEVGDNMVRLSAERKSKSKEGESSMSYSQLFSIPDGVDDAMARAEFEDGVLSITFPRAEGLKPRKIEVK